MRLTAKALRRLANSMIVVSTCSAGTGAPLLILWFFENGSVFKGVAGALLVAGAFACIEIGKRADLAALQADARARECAGEAARA